MRYLILLFLASLSIAAVSVDSAKTGKFPTRTQIAACTIIVTPADADMSVIGSKCYRDGQFLVVNTHVHWTGTGTAGAFTLSIASVTGAPLIDVEALPNGGGTVTNQGEDRLEGDCTYFNATTWFEAAPIYKSTTTFELALGSAHLGGTSAGSGGAVKCSVRMPIVGWY